MAGYAAALRVLTRYAVIDGRDMTAEAIRPRVKGETTFVDGLIAFAVDTANQCLVPQGIAKASLGQAQRRGALLPQDARPGSPRRQDAGQLPELRQGVQGPRLQAFMASQKANEARLKSAVEFGRAEMSEGSELHQSVLRAVLYAVMELVKNVDGSEVLAHLTLNVPDYYGDMTQRELADGAGRLPRQRSSRQLCVRRGHAPPASCASWSRTSGWDEQSTTMTRHQPLLLPPPAPRPCLPR